jgi:hypothetical protein
MPRYRLTARGSSARLFAALDHELAAEGASLAGPDRIPQPRAGPDAEDPGLTLVIVAPDDATVQRILERVKARLGTEQG